MKNSTLTRGGEVLGGMENEDPASALQTQLDGMFDDELEQAAIDMKHLLDASSAQFLVMVAEMDRRQIPHTEHVLSTKQWLKRFTGMSSTEASAAVSHWEQQVDYAAALDDTNIAYRRRRFSFNKSYQGMWSAIGDLDPESGHVIATALRSHTDPGNLDPGETRTMLQRNADALTDICRFWLDHNKDTAISGGERPHITVTIPYATLTGSRTRLGEIGDTAVDPEALRRLACDAGIVRIVTDGEGQPLDVGRRTRTVPPAMRRALDLRDRGCAWAGCDAPTSWCDAHHIIHWAHGGITALVNLLLLCRKHHTAVHNGKHPPDP